MVRGQSLQDQEFDRPSSVVIHSRLREEAILAGLIANVISSLIATSDFGFRSTLYTPAFRLSRSISVDPQAVSRKKAQAGLSNRIARARSNPCLSSSEWFSRRSQTTAAYLCFTTNPIA